MNPIRDPLGGSLVAAGTSSVHAQLEVTEAHEFVVPPLERASLSILTVLGRSFPLPELYAIPAQNRHVHLRGRRLPIVD
jgi:hypothetical protein